MSSVTLNGHTYSDDSHPTTGLAGGGHRTRFIPLIQDVVTVAQDVADAGLDALLAETQAGIATTQAGIATTQAGIATTQAGIATTQAGIATTQASAAATSAGQALTYSNNAQVISESGLPSQTGQAGKALLSNGTLTLWGAPAPAAHTHLAADLPPISRVKPFFMAGW